jgi:hypothetical protein
MLGLALANLLFSAEPPPADEGLHRGTGWYSTDKVPEPPFALALVIIGAAGMRARDRRMQRRAG